VGVAVISGRKPPAAALLTKMFLYSVNHCHHIIAVRNICPHCNRISPTPRDLLHRFAGSIA
jgi:hypothetical protein